MGASREGHQYWPPQGEDTSRRDRPSLDCEWARWGRSWCREVERKSGNLRQAEARNPETPIRRAVAVGKRNSTTRECSVTKGKQFCLNEIVAGVGWLHSTRNLRP